MVTCDRCGKETGITTMSYFNTDVICMECQELEEKHPAYERAKRVENEHVTSGDYNFAGIGLPDGYKEWAKSYE